MKGLRGPEQVVWAESNPLLMMFSDYKSWDLSQISQRLQIEKTNTKNSQKDVKEFFSS